MFDIGRLFASKKNVKLGGVRVYNNFHFHKTFLYYNRDRDIFYTKRLHQNVNLVKHLTCAYQDLLMHHIVEIIVVRCFLICLCGEIIHNDIFYFKIHV